MKILFLLPDDFPNSGACTALLNNLLSEQIFSGQFDKIAVAVYAHSLAQPPRTDCNGITVCRIVAAKTISAAQCVKEMGKLSAEAAKVLWHKIQRKICLSLPGGRIGRALYAPIEKALRWHDLEEYDVWVPVLGDFDLTLAAVQYKIQNPRIKLLIYQVDPCASNEACAPATRKKYAELERKIYEQADGILTTPILLAEAREKYGPEITDKMTAMEFPNVVPGRSGEKARQGADVRCVFAGNIYGNIRNPDYTFRLFQNLGEEIRLQMYGKMPESVKAEAEGAGHVCYGPQPLEAVREKLEEADFLVNIGNSMRNQVPSKIFEYISYGKPIINICKNRDCPSLEYLEKYPFVLNLFEENGILEEQRHKLRKFIREHCGRRVSPEEIEKRYRECTPRYCAGQMLEMIRRICDAEEIQKA